MNQQLIQITFPGLWTKGKFTPPERCIAMETVVPLQRLMCRPGALEPEYLFGLEVLLRWQES